MTVKGWPPALPRVNELGRRPPTSVSRKVREVGCSVRCPAGTPVLAIRRSTPDTADRCVSPPVEPVKPTSIDGGNVTARLAITTVLSTATTTTHGPVGPGPPHTPPGMGLAPVGAPGSDGAPPTGATSHEAPRSHRSGTPRPRLRAHR